MTILKIAQSKVSDNLKYTADLVSHIKNTFKHFNLSRDDDIRYLNENHFRSCLGLFKIVLSDLQIIALFAYFDNDLEGYHIIGYFISFILLKLLLLLLLLLKSF